MTRNRAPYPLARAARCGVLVAVALLALATAVGEALAQGASGPAWTELTAAEQQALEPLRGQWSAIDPARKAKWREVATRYHSLSPAEQQRLRARMVDWDGMSATQRTEARTRFRESNELPAAERKARWEAYQSLRPDQREELAARAASRPGSSDMIKGAGPDGRPSVDAFGRRPQEAVRPVGPGVVQARPGASTRPILQAPAPPRHQQPGLPKIAATPGFVDSTTLLPQRGPQGAAAQPKQRKENKR
jgi:hypothetical protein